MKQILSIARKELSSYFGSPMALIFVGTFLAAALFAFFWVDAFFARGIADVRPLFRWMPVLMIFLVAALTMRQWSEEQRSGTLEVLLTLPVRPVQLVLGKFLAVMALIALSLALTLFLPISVSVIGNLDWGPVVGGYLAALLMAGAYTAIGLFVSSRTDNQIVALILTVLVCGLFYAVGSSGVTDFVGSGVAELLRAFGAGSRFASIERGVIDLRDLVYYLSLAALFLTLNALSLDSKRWSQGPRTQRYRRSASLTALLLAANLVLLNVWLYPLHGLRLDLTAQKEYTLSQTTRDLLGNLQEPLLLRAYVSEQNHPLLAPLMPRVEDMLREYEIASGGRVVVDVVDPIEDPEKETEANQIYGIRPTPLQVSGRNEASVINAYFDILVRYGDQNTVLNFSDLIDFEVYRDGTVEVVLRNLEYDLTRAVKQVVSGFQSVDAVLAAMEEPAKLTLFVTRDSLPESLAAAPDTIETVAKDLMGKSGGKFAFEIVDPDVPNGAVTRQTLIEQYGLQPISVSLFGDQSYYLDMVLNIGDESQVLYPGPDLSEANVRTAIESALKRSTTGFLKVVGLWTPAEEPVTDMFGQQQQPFSTYRMVSQQLQQEYTVRDLDLSTGYVPSDVDTLAVVAPQKMTDAERFAIDQYLMRGGAVVIATGSYLLAPPDQFTGNLAIQPVAEGLQAMLESYGVRVENSLVMDPQNEPFPMPIDRQVGEFSVREIQAVNYPFFVDVRADGMEQSSPVASTLSAVTLNWASPLTLDETKNEGRETAVLLRSSAGSWLRTTPDIQPNLQQYPEMGFPVEGEQKSYPLAVSITGAFTSYFKDEPQPEIAQPEGAEAAPANLGKVESSPDTARLLVVGSGEFLNDVVFQISSSMSRDRYLNSLRLLQNAVDWSVQDVDLLAIRARGTQSRVLAPLSNEQQSFWEGLNYGLALLALVGIGVAWSWRRRHEKPMQLAAPQREADKPAPAGHRA